MKLTPRFNLRHSALAVLFIGTIGLSHTAMAQSFVNKKAPRVYEQVKVSEGTDQLTKLVRSNTPQSWAWFKAHSENFISKDILKFQGMIDGDPHNGNFGPTIVGGLVQWKLLDYDDAGTGPFVLDYAKFLIAVKAVEGSKKVKAADLWANYQRGLRGQSYLNTPPIISKYLNMSAIHFRKLEIEKASKFSSGNRLLNDGEKSTKITDEKIFNLVIELFRRNLPENLQVLDVGGREKEGGGSGSINGERGALRFIALVKGSDGRNTIFELKQDGDSGIKNYQPQFLTLQEVLDFHVLGQNGKDKSYQEVRLNIEGDKTFVLRPKPIYFYDYANKAKSQSQFAEFEALSHYNAWYKGYMHGQQIGAKEYLKAIELDNQAKILSGLKDMTGAYLEHLQSFLPK